MQKRATKSLRKDPSEDEEINEPPKKTTQTLADRVKLRRQQQIDIVPKFSVLVDGSISYQQDTTLTPVLVKPGDIVKKHGVILTSRKTEEHQDPSPVDMNVSFM